MSTGTLQRNHKTRRKPTTHLEVCWAVMTGQPESKKIGFRNSSVFRTYDSETRIKSPNSEHFKNQTYFETKKSGRSVRTSSKEKRQRSQKFISNPDQGIRVKDEKENRRASQRGHFNRGKQDLTEKSKEVLQRECGKLRHQKKMEVLTYLDTF